MRSQRAEVDWSAGGVPLSRRFKDPYYSLENGLAEARHVFLAGNDLPRRFRPGFHIAELGFGTGLNLLAALAMWRSSGIAGVLHYTSFEAFPLSASDMIRAQAGFDEVTGLAQELAPYWERGAHGIDLPDLRLRVVAGDVRQTLTAWDGQADAWFLDGFAPARNPEMWEDAVLAQVVHHMRPGATLATYTAAGFVRRALADAGLTVRRVPGFGRKRHMTQARNGAA